MCESYGVEPDVSRGGVRADVLPLNHDYYGPAVLALAAEGLDGEGQGLPYGGTLHCHRRSGYAAEEHLRRDIVGRHRQLHEGIPTQLMPKSQGSHREHLFRQDEQRLS